MARRFLRICGERHFFDTAWYFRNLVRTIILQAYLAIKLVLPFEFFKK